MKKLLFIFSILFYSFLCSAQKYEYPILPGTSEWKKLENYQQMLDVCQIPEKKLKSMSTDELIQTCLDFPISVSYYAFNNMYEGVDNLTANFNGLQELLIRKDNAKSLSKLIDEIDINNIVNSKELAVEKKGFEITKIALIETLLTLPEVLENVNNETVKLIMDKAYDNLIIKEQKPDFFSSYSVESSALLLGVTVNIMINDSLTVRNYKSILKSGNILKKERLNELKKSYINLRLN